MATYHTIDGGKNILPQLLVEMNFAGAAFSSDWTDVTADVRTLAYSSAGRNDVLARTSAGSLVMTLDNRAADYDPTNASSPYYPNVKRYIGVRVTALWSGMGYRRWVGSVTGYQQAWPESGKDATCVVTGTDLLGVLSVFDMVGNTFTSETSDARVTDVCALAGINVRADDTGASTLVAITTPLPVGSMALAHLLDVEETENGRIFTGVNSPPPFHIPRPCVVFQSRHYRLLNSATSVGTIGDHAGEIPYSTGTLTSDDTQLWNQAEVTTTNSDGSAGSVATATTTATDSPTTRTLQRTILSSDTVEAQSCAEYLVGLYGQPAPKLPALDLLPQRDPTNAWPIVLSAVNSDRFTWKRRAAGNTISLDGYLEQYTERITPGESWIPTWQLLPADDQTGWILGDSVNGVLGSTTRLSY